LYDLNERYKYNEDLFGYSGVNMFGKPEFYGNTTVGERGQIVLPADLREKFKIKPGDKLLVLGGEEMGSWGVLLVKAEVLSLMLERFGESIEQIAKEAKKK